MAKEATKSKKTSPANPTLSHGTGRRKKSVARAWFKRGKGGMRVNNLDVKNYFDTANTIRTAMTPFRVIPAAEQYDIRITVEGGGKVAQADAIKLAIARGLVSLDESIRSTLRKEGLLTVDSRQKERKKYGQKAARRKFQFVKR